MTLYITMVRRLCVFLINVYQIIFSPDKGIIKNTGFTPSSICMFYPTCSEYSKEAIEKYGVGKGVMMSFKRILRCHPKQKDFIDIP